jgi:hypothetical protein
VSGSGAGRLAQHYSAIDAAIAAGVERIVYTSFLAAAPLATFTDIGLGSPVHSWRGGIARRSGEKPSI